MVIPQISLLVSTKPTTCSYFNFFSLSCFSRPCFQLWEWHPHWPSQQMHSITLLLHPSNIISTRYADLNRTRIKKSKKGKEALPCPSLRLSRLQCFSSQVCSNYRQISTWAQCTQCSVFCSTRWTLDAATAWRQEQCRFPASFPVTQSPCRDSLVLQRLNKRYKEWKTFLFVDYVHAGERKHILSRK